MAYPYVRINNVTGSNTAASGAGPATAVTGADAQMVTATTSMALRDATDLSGVATDGSAAIYVAAGSGRRFSRIVGKKDDFVSFTGDVTNGSAVVPNVSSTAGLSVGDTIIILGSVPFRNRIASIDSSTQITLGTAYGSTTAAGITIERPRQVVLDDGFNLGATAWAIGGKRKDFETTNAHTKDLFLSTAGASAGWIIDIEETGTDYVLTSTITVSAGGSTTVGWLRFISSSSTKPNITSATNSVNLFTLSGGIGWSSFENLKLSHTAATRGIAFSFLSTNTPVRYRNILCDGCLQFNAGNQSSVIQIFEGCEIKNTTSTSQALIALGSGNQIWAYDCYIHDNAGDGYRTSTNAAAVHSFERCRIVNNAGHGILSNMTATAATLSIRHCTIANNGGDGIHNNTNTSTNIFDIVENAIYGNTGAGIGNADDQISTEMSMRNYARNAIGGNGGGSYSGISASLTDLVLTADPFANAASRDYTPNTTAGGGAVLRGAGAGGGDIGAVQSTSSGGSGSPLNLGMTGGMAA